MSDFDKEAERERLREQFEREEEKRETTERMSELLLKGATMTDTHCNQCGDPIFRYDGQEFCPSCQQPVEDGTPVGENGETATEATEQAETQAESTESEDTATPEAAADQSEGATAESTQTDDQRDTAEPAQSRPDAETPTEPPRAVEPSRVDVPEPSGERAVERREPARDASASADASLADVRESLLRILREQTRRADAAEDPRRTRDHLAAAREAAETLDTLPY
jgi:uncharacterized Zn finger protein (UPF0148 family)